MMTTFCAMSNLKAFMRSPQCPQELHPCVRILEECYGQNKSVTLNNDVRTLTRVATAGSRSSTQRKCFRMDSDIYDALLRYARQAFAGWKPDNEATHYSRYNIGGLDFTKWTTGERDSVIFFPTLPDNRPVPARIQDIISLTRNGQELIFLAVHRFKPVNPEVDNPFVRYKDFGASLWSTEQSEKVEIVPATEGVSHAIRRQWVEGTCVLKPSNRSINVHNINV
jgi:hypothetical protein